MMAEIQFVSRSPLEGELARQAVGAVEPWGGGLLAKSGIFPHASRKTKLSAQLLPLQGGA